MSKKHSRRRVDAKRGSSATGRMGTSPKMAIESEPKPQKGLEPLGKTTAAEQSQAAPKPPSRWQWIREILVLLVALASFIVSCGSNITSKRSLAISLEQAELTKRVHQEHVKPDVKTVVRHSSLPQDRDSPMAVELVVWDNGPIKAVSVDASYRLYVVDSNTFQVVASMGTTEDLLDHSIVKPELPVAEPIRKSILGAGPLALFVVDLTYYRETDMEKFSSEDYFLYDNGTFYDRDGFRSRTNYESMMASLQAKMKWESLNPRNANQSHFRGPSTNGGSFVDFNILTPPQSNSPEWTLILSNYTQKINVNPEDAFAYEMRGQLYGAMHNIEGAAVDYETAIRFGATNYECYNNLSCIRSSAAIASLRNGIEAVSLARKACELTDWKEWACIATLAAAYAETGDFGFAVQYQKQALAMDGMMPLEREDEERKLSLFNQHQPSRDTK